MTSHYNTASTLIQKRWAISMVGDGTTVWAAVELADEPFTVRRWKRIDQNEWDDIITVQKYVVCDENPPKAGSPREELVITAMPLEYYLVDPTRTVGRAASNSWRITGPNLLTAKYLRECEWNYILGDESNALQCYSSYLNAFKASHDIASNISHSVEGSIQGCISNEISSIEEQSESASLEKCFYYAAIRRTIMMSLTSAEMDWNRTMTLSRQVLLELQSALEDNSISRNEALVSYMKGVVGMCYLADYLEQSSGLCSTPILPTLNKPDAVRFACHDITKWMSLDGHSKAEFLTENICPFLMTHKSAASNDTDMDRVISVAMSLTSLGAVVPASIHLVNSLRKVHNWSEYPPLNIQLRLILTKYSVAGKYWISDLLDWEEQLLTLNTVRAALLLSTIPISPAFVSSHDFGIYLGQLFQTCTPVIMESNFPTASKEAVLLRLLLQETLSIIIHPCQNAASDCVLRDAASHVGSRGLFLLAYQGLEILTRGLINETILMDQFVPRQYFELSLLLNPSVSLLANSFNHTPPSVEEGTSGRASAHPRIRVGFLSSFLYRHSVGRLIANVIINLNRSLFEVFVLTDSGQRKPDDISTELRRKINGSNWITLSRDIETSIPLARGLSLDVLVFGDLFMDAITAHLAMMRISRIQIAFWGHPFTSGYPAIDYFISSDHMEGLFEDRQSQFSEQIVRFETLGFHMFQKPTNVRQYSKRIFLDHIFGTGFDLSGKRLNATNPRELTRNGEYRIYSCFQSLMKMHPMFDEAIAEILKLDHNAIILFVRNKKQHIWQHRFGRRLTNRLEREFLSSNRVILFEQMSHDDYLRIVCSSHVFLDPFPFGGGVTITDSLECEDEFGRKNPVPFVTSSRLQSVHRIGSAIAHHLNDLSLAVDSGAFSDSSEAYNFTKLVHQYAGAAVELASGDVDATDQQIDSIERTIRDPNVFKEWEAFLAQSSL